MYIRESKPRAYLLDGKFTSRSLLTSMGFAQVLKEDNSSLIFMFLSVAVFFHTYSDSSAKSLFSLSLFFSLCLPYTMLAFFPADLQTSCMHRSWNTRPSQRSWTMPSMIWPPCRCCFLFPSPSLPPLCGWLKYLTWCLLYYCFTVWRKIKALFSYFPTCFYSCFHSFLCLQKHQHQHHTHTLEYKLLHISYIFISIRELQCVWYGIIICLKLKRFVLCFESQQVR